MKKSNQLSPAAFQLNGRMPLKQAIPLGLQHVLAMFVGNLTPLLIITGACGIAGGEFAIDGKTYTHSVSCAPKKEERKEGVNYYIGDLQTYEQQPQATAEQINAAPCVSDDDDLLSNL